MFRSPKTRTHRLATLSCMLMTAFILSSAGSANAGDATRWSDIDRGNQSANTHRDGSHRLGAPRPVADDDQPTRPVPEPGAISLVAMGLMAVAAGVRKLRKA